MADLNEVRIRVGGEDSAARIGVGEVLILEGDPYEGAYTVTPSSSEQTLLTKGKTMGSNVVVEPIPNNYGLITWNGSVLTVS